MNNSEQITSQMKLLEAHRQTLSVYLRQTAIFSTANTPPHVYHGIKEARDNIRKIKATLLQLGVKVNDLPDDFSSSEIEETEDIIWADPISQINKHLSNSSKYINLQRISEFKSISREYHFLGIKKEWGYISTIAIILCKSSCNVSDIATNIVLAHDYILENRESIPLSWEHIGWNANLFIIFDSEAPLISNIKEVQQLKNRWEFSGTHGGLPTALARFPLSHFGRGKPNEWYIQAYTLRQQILYYPTNWKRLDLPGFIKLIR